ncbi:BON domain-containing protein [Pseudoduganella eburnea]|uniref:BON domain-containing protein n=1 Tax=Massilia eburnea TaxID=1776165 RepID=A0A6L6QD01_9BURK|nr:BON domain-containing protein [Massilia eburnea]MTW10039.1 BON domain-containing protein [Massilia eburnea]
MLTDSDIKKHVEQQLIWETDSAAKDLAVSVREKIVTLSGFVHSYDQKVRVENAAERVVGVAGVANDVEVRLAGDPRLDADIARDCASALVYQLPQSAATIKIVVDHGLVKLEGQVERNYQRVLAEKAMRSIRGVRGVANHIELHPTVEPKDVQRQIVAAFHRIANVDAAHIKVEAVGGTVVLDGTVHSWAERVAAEHAAWMAPGVSHVVDRLSIDTSPVP